MRIVTSRSQLIFHRQVAKNKAKSQSRSKRAETSSIFELNSYFSQFTLTLKKLPSDWKTQVTPTNHIVALLLLLFVDKAIAQYFSVKESFQL